MRAVEEPELAPLVGGDVVDESDADVVQGNQSGDRFHDPRAVSLRGDCSQVQQTQAVGDDLYVVLGRRGHHPVDHRVGEQNLGLDPRREVAVDALGDLEDACAEDGAIVEEVVERGEDRRVQPVPPALGQRQRDEPGCGRPCVRRVWRLQGARVALLGDGQRHQFRGRCGHCVERGGHPGLHGGQRADHLERGFLAGLAHGDGEEPVLWLELFLRPPVPHGDAPDQRGPTKAEERVGVDGEVGPGERSETEMGDARSAGTVVVRQGGRPCLVQRAGAQPLPFADRHSSPRQRQDAV